MADNSIGSNVGGPEDRIVSASLGVSRYRLLRLPDPEFYRKAHLFFQNKGRPSARSVSLQIEANGTTTTYTRTVEYRRSDGSLVNTVVGTSTTWRGEDGIMYVTCNNIVLFLEPEEYAWKVWNGTTVLYPSNTNGLTVSDVSPTYAEVLAEDIALSTGGYWFTAIASNGEMLTRRSYTMGAIPDVVPLQYRYANVPYVHYDGATASSIYTASSASSALPASSILCLYNADAVHANAGNIPTPISYTYTASHSVPQPVDVLMSGTPYAATRWVIHRNLYDNEGVFVDVMWLSAAAGLAGDYLFANETVSVYVVSGPDMALAYASAYLFRHTPSGAYGFTLNPSSLVTPWIPQDKIPSGTVYQNTLAEENTRQAAHSKQWFLSIGVRWLSDLGKGVCRFDRRMDTAIKSILTANRYVKRKYPLQETIEESYQDTAEGRIVTRRARLSHTMDVVHEDGSVTTTTRETTIEGTLRPSGYFGVTVLNSVWSNWYIPSSSNGSTPYPTFSQNAARAVVSRQYDKSVGRVWNGVETELQSYFSNSEYIEGPEFTPSDTYSTRPYSNTCVGTVPAFVEEYMQYVPLVYDKTQSTPSLSSNPVAQNGQTLRLYLFSRTDRGIFGRENTGTLLYMEGVLTVSSKNGFFIPVSWRRARQGFYASIDTDEEEIPDTNCVVEVVAIRWPDEKEDSKAEWRDAQPPADGVEDTRGAYQKIVYGVVTEMRRAIADSETIWYT